MRSLTVAGLTVLACLVAGAPTRPSPGPDLSSVTPCGSPDSTVNPVSQLAVANPRFVVPVHAHVLRSAAEGGIPYRRILRQVRWINRSYAGGQSAASARAPFTLRVVSSDVTVNRNWYHMNEGSIAERNAKRALHQGDAGELNLYFVKSPTDVLGWATQPSSYNYQPFMDGVVVQRRTLPGGSRGHYSSGDAAVHEIGHWLGLLHTFAGRCSSRGDLVADTPSQARPSYRCPVRRDTCAAPGHDPVHNFMNYSYDSCMNRFTRGQVIRMGRLWVAFRAGAGV